MLKFIIEHFIKLYIIGCILSIVTVIWFWNAPSCKPNRDGVWLLTCVVILQVSLFAGVMLGEYKQKKRQLK